MFSGAEQRALRDMIDARPADQAAADKIIAGIEQIAQVSARLTQVVEQLTERVIALEAREGISQGEVNGSALPADNKTGARRAGRTKAQGAN